MIKSIPSTSKKDLVVANTNPFARLHGYFQFIMQILLQIIAEYLDINESSVATVIICYILILGLIWGLIRFAAFIINKFVVEKFAKYKNESKFYRIIYLNLLPVHHTCSYMHMCN